MSIEIAGQTVTMSLAEYEELLARAADVPDAEAAGSSAAAALESELIGLPTRLHSGIHADGRRRTPRRLGFTTRALIEGLVPSGNMPERTDKTYGENAIAGLARALRVPIEDFDGKMK